jgi:hypothetical protein
MCTNLNGIGGASVNPVASSVVDRGFEPRLGQTKDYTIGIWWFSAKYATLGRKTDWLEISIMCPK